VGEAAAEAGADRSDETGGGARGDGPGDGSRRRTGGGADGHALGAGSGRSSGAVEAGVDGSADGAGEGAATHRSDTPRGTGAGGEGGAGCDEHDPYTGHGLGVAPHHPGAAFNGAVHGGHLGLHGGEAGALGDGLDDLLVDEAGDLAAGGVPGGTELLGGGVPEGVAVGVEVLQRVPAGVGVAVV
jgi:hypothetical protein